MASTQCDSQQNLFDTAHGIGVWFVQFISIISMDSVQHKRQAARETCYHYLHMSIAADRNEKNERQYTI